MQHGRDMDTRIPAFSRASLCVRRGAAKRLVEGRKGCYVHGMDGNSEHDNKTEQLLARDQRLARGIVEWCKEFGPDAAHSIEATAAVETAGTLAKIAATSFKWGHPEDGLRSISIAQDIKHGAVMTVLLPSARRGDKVMSGAQSGHEAVHGTKAEKDARWTRMAKDFKRELERGTGKDAAYCIVAEKHGVCDRTVRRAVKQIEKIV